MSTGAGRTFCVFSKNSADQEAAETADVLPDDALGEVSGGDGVYEKVKVVLGIDETDGGKFVPQY